MPQSWKQYEGQIVNGYPLEQYLGGSETDAVFFTVHGTGSRPAAIRLSHAVSSETSHRLALWDAASRLSHPALLALLDSGRCEIDGRPLIYAVMERSEGNVAGVLPERALTETEAREMLEPVLSALTYLHEQGFIHAGLRPSNVMAIGEQIKLAGDCLARAGDRTERRPGNACPPPESWDGFVSPASDVWSLGATLVEALTRRAPDPGGAGADPPIPGGMPKPFGEIARNCLRVDPGARWTPAQIMSRLRGPQLAPVPAPAVGNTPRAWGALYAVVAAIVVVIVVGILALRNWNRPEVVEQPSIAATPSTFPQRVEAAPPTTAPLTAAPDQERKSGSWFVVVATYAQKEAAEKKAESLAKIWPRFNLETYTPALQFKQYSLVVIGSRLTQKSALELQQRARSSGMARDAYITQFQ
jgi:hypothetical protein